METILFIVLICILLWLMPGIIASSLLFLAFIGLVIGAFWSWVGESVRKAWRP